MKAILYFVKGGKVRDSHKEIATAISVATEKRVVFRNSSAAEQTGEKAEPNDGVAGDIPSTYQHCAKFNDAGEQTAAADVVDTEEGGEGELNSLGLPAGSPDDKASLQAALTEAGVDFHPRNNVEKLVALYQAEVIGTDA